MKMKEAMKNGVQLFKLSDFNLASYLLAQGFSLLSIDKSNRRRATFIFENSPKLQSLVQNFWTYKATVEPRRLFGAQKELKQMLLSNSYPAQENQKCVEEQ